MLLVSTDTNKFVVVQSNELVEATYSPELTTRAHKVSRLILSLINPDDKDLKLYTISIDSLKKFLGHKESTTWGNFYPELKDIADRLNREPIVIKSGDKIITAYFIAGYAIDTAQRTVTFEVSLLLKPYLLELKKNFTRYPLQNIAGLRSAYSIRLYELLVQYRTIGHRTFELAELQRQLGSNYNFYGNFKDKVLNIAKRDLDSGSDIRFEYDEIKTARRVTSLKFRIFPNTATAETIAEKPAIEALVSDIDPSVKNPFQTVLSLTTPTELATIIKIQPSEQLAARLSKSGIAPDSVQKYFSQSFDIIADAAQRDRAKQRVGSDFERLCSEKLAILEKTTKSKTSNPTGFFIKALREDWLPEATPTATAAAKPAANRPLPMDVKNQIRRLDTQIQQIKKAWAAAKQPIFEEIVGDTEGFARLFESVRSQSSGAMRATIFPENLTSTEIFMTGSMASNLLKIRMEADFSERFVAVNTAYGGQLKILENAFEELKKASA